MPSQESHVEPIHHEKKESVDMIVVAPPVEGLMHPDQDSFWPVEIKSNVELQEEAMERVLFRKSLDTLFAENPLGKEIDESSNQEGMIELYTSATKFLNRDTHNSRIVLYMPFEVLPDKNKKSDSVEFEKAREEFAEAYLSAWNTLLISEDVRANFTDGDFTVEELYTQEYPRVVKAAHLIPELLQKGLISSSDMFTTAEVCYPSVLSESIYEGLRVAGDRGLLLSYQEQQLAKIPVPKIKNASIDIPVSTRVESLSKARTDWLIKEAKKAEIEEVADQLMSNVLNGQMSPVEFNDALKSSDPDEVVAALIGLKKIIEYFAQEGNDMAKTVYEKCRDEIGELWQKGTPRIQDTLLRVWSHLSVYNIISKSDIEKYGVEFPVFDGLFLENKKSVESYLENLEAALAEIKEDTELSQSVYPVSILYGGRIKGYATADSDFDRAIFIKPGVQIEERFKLREKLAEIFNRHQVGGEPMEFWLSEDLQIKNLPLEDNLIAASRLTSSLFEGAWCGDVESIKQLHEKTLTPYLYSEGKKEVDGTRDARKIWLEELERNTLQYRLLHRGYDEFFPTQTLDTEHANGIDGDSSFWDAGYRRLATKLFVSKVFLPQLHK